jgi:hypothetical protein
VQPWPEPKKATWKRWVGAAAVAGALAATWVAVGGLVADVAEPAFEVEARDGSFEIRRYAARVLAETRVEGGWRVAGNLGFRRLANYIFGGNARQSRIAMTAPVGERPDGAAGWLVSFTMPQGETLKSLPSPLTHEVRLREVPPARVAVVRFGGRWTEARMAEREAALRHWLREQALEPVGDAEVNRYDPPWTLWFMRRNEIWLELPAG